MNNPTTKMTTEKLVTIFKRMEARVNKALTAAEDKGLKYTAEWAAAQKAEIFKIIKETKEGSDEWLKDSVPEFADVGIGIYADQWKDAGERPPMQAFAGIRQDVVRVIVKQSSLSIGDALQTIATRADSHIRRLQEEVAVAGIAAGWTHREIAKEFRQRMVDSGGANIVAGGWKGSPEAYARMVGRTVLRKATRAATMESTLEAGLDLVKVIGDVGCDWCAPWVGQVLSITGRSKNYPTVSAAESAGLNHPNCDHVFAPYVEELADDQEKEQVAQAAKEGAKLLKELGKQGEKHKPSAKAIKKASKKAMPEKIKAAKAAKAAKAPKPAKAKATPPPKAAPQSAVAQLKDEIAGLDTQIEALQKDLSKSVTKTAKMLYQGKINKLKQQKGMAQSKIDQIEEVTKKTESALEALHEKPKAKPKPKQAEDPYKGMKTEELEKLAKSANSLLKKAIEAADKYGEGSPQEKKAGEEYAFATKANVELGKRHVALEPPKESAGLGKTGIHNRQLRSKHIDYAEAYEIVNKAYGVQGGQEVAQAVRGFSHHGDQPIRKYQFSNGRIDEEFETSKIGSGRGYGYVDMLPSQAVPLIKRYFDAAPAFKGTAHRGIALETFREHVQFIEDYKQGSTFEFKAFASSSTSKRVALDFAASAMDESDHSHTILLHMTVKGGGTSIRGFSNFIGEDEVLMHSGAQFKITNVKVEGGSNTNREDFTTTTLYMEQV